MRNLGVFGGPSRDKTESFVFSCFRGYCLSTRLALALLFLSNRVLNPALVLIEVALNAYVLWVNRDALGAQQATLVQLHETREDLSAILESTPDTGLALAHPAGR